MLSLLIGTGVVFVRQKGESWAFVTEMTPDGARTLAGHLCEVADLADARQEEAPESVTLDRRS